MKVNQLQYSFRLNLDNPRDLEVHRVLRDLNKDLYKSKSNFIISTLWEAIQRRQAADEKNEQILKQEISDELRAEIIKQVKKEVMEDITRLLLSAVAYRPMELSADATITAGYQNKGNEPEQSQVQTDDFDPALVEMADLYGA